MLQMTRYYEDFLDYYDKAKRQQEACNLGPMPHAEFKLGDDLMENVTLYDVVERKYAGFSQIMNDCFYGCGFDHPYDFQARLGTQTKEREHTRQLWMEARNHFGLPEWLYVFIVHRVTGSGINYAKQPSGYHNTILMDEEFASTTWRSGDHAIEAMARRVLSYEKPKYTSIGYQFPKFPKPDESIAKRGGDWYLFSYAPRLARDLASFLERSDRLLALREVGDFMFEWNRKNGLNAYRFQYAAVIADIADWFPQFVDRESPFYYGTNAIECISYLADKPRGMKTQDFLDSVMRKIYEDTGSVPYNAEDVCCDYIRWVENYCKPGHAYNHIDLDKVWSSSSIKDHPRGRQKAMLDMGLVKTFNGMKSHPSDTLVLDHHGIHPAAYQRAFFLSKRRPFEVEPIDFSAGDVTLFT